jgi:hypothetical protein
MSERDGPEELTPAEQALEHHLELLRSHVPAPPVTMDRRIIRRARWQRSLRRPLLTFGHFAAAIRDGVRLLMIPPKHR